MPPKKAAAPKKSDPKKSNKSGGKAKKKKWSKGKAREQLNNAVFWDKNLKDKLEKEVPKYKVITVAVISERVKVNGSLAREALAYLCDQGIIKPVSVSSKIRVYTKVEKDEE